jgi:2-polyprenyl-6-methoxyphenol hydroxylase-like FAD-dependent oxidoreductase
MKGTSVESWDVVICGAGVAGLATARALTRRGLRILLLEKQKKPVPIAKGEVLQPGCLRILEEWGLLPQLEERGAVRLDRLSVRQGDGTQVMLFDYTTLASPYRSLLSHDYAVICEVLANNLGDAVEWRRGALVEGLLRDERGRVTGVRVAEGERKYEVRAALVVAADGLSSRLRQLAGVRARPVTYTHRLVSFDIAGVPGLPREVSAYVTGRGLRLLYPLPHDRARLYVQVGPEELRGAGRDELAALCHGLTQDTPALAAVMEPLLASLDSRQFFTLMRFTASRLAVPGLALVGEAAHSVHPMAAQGLNTAIADAHALAGQLAAVGSLEATSVDRALRGYHSERSTWVDHIDRMSHDATRMITDTSWEGRLLGRRLLRHTSGNPRLSYVATYNLAGLGVRPFTVLDRFHQLGLPDPRANKLPAWS